MLKIQQLSFWERQYYFEDIDFLVIGGGIVGSSTAYHLRLRYPDAKIVILERGYLPSGASTKNAGFACFGSPTELIEDLQNMPSSEVWETVHQRYEGLKYMQELLGTDAIGFERNGSWDIITKNEKLVAQEVREQLNILNKELHSITGNQSVFSEDRSAKDRFGFAGVETCFHNCLEGQVHTAQLMQRYHELLVQHGILTLYGIDVKDIHADTAQVETEVGFIAAKHIFLTVNGFAGRWLPEEVFPARAQVLVTSPIPALKLKGTYHYQAGYYYFRNIGNRILLGGGRNLDKQGETTTELQTTELIQTALHTLLNEVIIPDTSYTVDYSWAGIMGVGSAKKPIIRQVHKYLSVGVRLGGMGVAIGSLVGKQLAAHYQESKD